MNCVVQSLRLAVLLLSAGNAVALLASEAAQTGPETEKRFPPLQVPAGFKATLFACDPLVEYPSVIAAGPRPGAVFVAYDYMTGLGTEITRRDEVRLVEDTDGDGYADKSTLFAGGFNSIMGLAYHEGTVYVMHAPYLTALRDANGTGTADERKDLLSGLGLTPEQNPVRLHCANGVTVGHDGWLYLALGDNGVNVPRPEGDRLILNGGGILRCRPDGRDLHVFSSGLRNIYDVALDAELNVFVRDNENDGGTYKIRVCHSFHGADHGYPYLYEERPDEALPPLADLGLGSSAGGVCYLERQFPAEYRGGLFNCEWGKSLVFYPLVRKESSFQRRDEIEFAVGAANDPYGFKPTDVIVQRDGTLMVSDWCDGQRPMRGRGRIYHIAYVGEGGAASVKPIPRDAGAVFWSERLHSESYTERCDAQRALKRLGKEGVEALLSAIEAQRLEPRGRLHAVWILAHVGGAAEIDRLLEWAKSDPDPTIRAQAVRAVADLADPVFVRQKLRAGRGAEEVAVRLAALGSRQDSRVVLEIVVALGRLQWKGAPDWLRQQLSQPDIAQSHAAQQTLRCAANWPAVLALLDLPGTPPLRTIALRAISGEFETEVVDGLLARLAREQDPARRREYADALTRVHRQPGAWMYWGYRPAPRAPHTVPWERTEAIAAALHRALADPDPDVRLFVLRRMRREQALGSPAALLAWLSDERNEERVAALLEALPDLGGAEILPQVEAVVRDPGHALANRLAGLKICFQGLAEGAPERRVALAKSLEDGPVLAEALRRLGKIEGGQATSLLLGKLASSHAETRAAAIEALGELRASEAAAQLAPLLADGQAGVRSAAATAAGKLAAKEAVEPLLGLARDPDPAVRRASLETLRVLREPKAVPLAVSALADRETSLVALDCLRELGSPEQAAAVVDLAKRDPAGGVALAAIRALSAWRSRPTTRPARWKMLERAVAEIHGSSGVLIGWRESGPLSGNDAPAIVAAAVSTGFASDEYVLAAGSEGRVLLAPKDAAQDAQWLAGADLLAPESTEVEFLASSSGSLEVWLNGKSLYRRERARNFQIDSDRFSGTLAQGENRLLVMVGPTPASVEFHLRFRRKSASPEHERLTQAVLSRKGNAERGKVVLENVEKSLCLKCHRLNERGEKFGPELTGVGNRFSHIYLTESILNPSRNIAPSFNTLSAVMKDGLIVSGVKVAETDAALTLADNQGKRHELAKEQIAELRPIPVSTMPEGLEKRLSEEEFLDLIAYLSGLVETRAP